MANYVKHPTIKVGDQVRCLRRVLFVDRENHERNDIIFVEEDTLDYFKIFTPGKYEVVG
jgi:hypothetical protein